MWPIMECPGRTASPSTCQSRTSDSHDCGSVKPPCTRTDSTKRESWVVVATYAHKIPPGRRGHEGQSQSLNIEGPELLHKYVGETERHIRLVFQRARE